MMFCSLNSFRKNCTIKHFKNKLVLFKQARKISVNENQSMEQVDFRIPSTTVKEKLRELKIQFSEGYTCYHIKTCVICSKGENDVTLPESVSFFINKKTGHFLCKKCKISGDWCVLAANFNSSKNFSIKQNSNKSNENSAQLDISNKWQEILKATDPLFELNDKEFNEILKCFRFAQCSKKQIENLNVRVNKTKSTLFFPMFNSDCVVGFRALELSGSTKSIPKSDCSGCISLIVNKESQHIIVVADIRDLIALMSLNIQENFVCLPHGIMSLPQSLLPYFEQYEKITLWLGEELGSWYSSIQFAKKLNEKRCYLIRPTESQISVVRAISCNQNVKELISTAKPIWHQFVTTFSTLREDIQAELQNTQEMNGISWTRFPALNEILKGHRRGELTILTGQTGCGKTTFMSEYSLDLAMKGVNTLWGSFEIKNSRLALTMLKQFSQTQITDNLETFNFWADKFENLPIYFMTFHGQHSIKTVMNAVEHCSYVYDIAHVIIDNVQFMIDISNDWKFVDRFWVQDCVLQSFRRFATVNNCHVSLVMHPRKEIDGVELSMNSIFGTAKAAQEADNILIIQSKNTTSMADKKYLQICKNRFSGDLGIVPLYFDKKCRSFSFVKDNSKETSNRKSRNTQEKVMKSQP